MPFRRRICRSLKWYGEHKEPFRPGCSFVFASVFLYFLFICVTGEWGIILGPVAFMAICTAIILEAIADK